MESVQVGDGLNTAEYEYSYNDENPVRTGPPVRINHKIGCPQYGVR